MKLLLTLVLLYVSIMSVNGLQFVHTQYYTPNKDNTCSQLYWGEYDYENVCTLAGQTYKCLENGSVAIQWYGMGSCMGPVVETQVQPSGCSDGSIISCVESIEVPSNSYSAISTFQNICPTNGDNSWAKYITSLQYQVVDTCFEFQMNFDNSRIYHCNDSVAYEQVFPESTTCETSASNKIENTFMPCTDQNPYFTICGNAFLNN